MAESFVSTLKAELVSNLEFPSRRAAKTAIFEYLETFYNTRRLHSSLGYKSPADFEEDSLGEARVAKVDVSALAGEVHRSAMRAGWHACSKELGTLEPACLSKAPPYRGSRLLHRR